MEIQSEANVVIASGCRDAIAEVRLDRRDLQPSNRSDQIDRVNAVSGVGLTRKRMGCALIVHLQTSTLNSLRQSGLSRQAAIWCQEAGGGRSVSAGAVHQE